MKNAILMCAVILLSILPLCADSNAETVRDLVALERQAMNGFLKGDPSPALAIFDPEISLFHIMTAKRLDGLPAVQALYETYRGRPLFESYEIVDPKVQGGGDLAVLTYLFVFKIGDVASRWNSTQVYQRKKDGWRVIHAHWSRVQPAQ